MEYVAVASCTPPGAVEETESLALWIAKPNCSYPQEVGIILLTAQPTTVKAIRLTIDLGSAPSQIFIYAAKSSPSESEAFSKATDAVSRYLSATWNQCCDSLKWKASGTGGVNSPREVKTTTVRLDCPHCSFLKFIVHAAQNVSTNQHQQVAIEDIELRGTTRICEDNHFPGSMTSDLIHRSILSSSNEAGDLRRILLEADVPMELVLQIISVERDDHCLSAVTNAPESNAPEANPKEPSQCSALSEQEGHEKVCEKTDKLVSPFDVALREYVDQTSRETAMLEEILATDSCKNKHGALSWQLPVIPLADPANTPEIAKYTFGEFFTQCLLCGGPDVQTTCTQTAERCSRMLKQSVGEVAAFEGLVSCSVLAVREAKSPQVFHAAVHLAHTVFQATVPQLVGTGANPLSDTHGAVESPTLGLIENVGREIWSQGLRTVLMAAISSRHCWCATIRTTTQPKKKSTVPPSIDREFLQFIRLLLSQELTRANVFRDLLNMTLEEHMPANSCSVNRMRLLRLILRSDILCEQLSPEVKEGIRALCKNKVALIEEGTDGHHSQERIAKDCLKELHRLDSQNKDGVKGLIKTVRGKFGGSDAANIYPSQLQRHVPAFVQFPLTSMEVAEWSLPMKNYFSSHPRPNALYHHNFVNSSQQENENDRHEDFQKGNIAFRGQVVPRTPPTKTFHEQIEQNTKPFVFDVVDQQTEKIQPQLSGRQEIVSSFAVFRGAIEKRSENSQRSSRVAPEVAATAPTTTTLPQSSDAIPLKLSKQVSEEPTKPSSADQREGKAADIQPVDQPPDLSQIGEQVTQQKPSAPPQVDKNAKSQGKGKSKAKEKAKGNAKEQDNCVLQ